MKRLILAFALLSVLSCSSKNSRNSSDGIAKSSEQIEVKTDRFTGITTITLKPQKLISTQDLDISVALKTSVGGESQSHLIDFDFKGNVDKKYDVSASDLYFLVDGERLKIARQSLSEYLDVSAMIAPPPPPSASPPSSSPQPAASKENSVELRPISCGWKLSREKLSQIAEGTEVEMKLGSIEMKLDPKLLATLRDYLQIVSDH